MTKISAQARKAIKAYSQDCNGERYRITRNGEVHIYGRMPNSIETGWWLAAQSVPEMIARINGDIG